MAKEAFEFKLQKAELKTVDTDKIAEIVADAKDKVTKEVAALKAKIDQTDIKQTAEDLFKSFPMYIDGPRLRVRVGETYIKANNQSEFDEIVKYINDSFDSANKEFKALWAKFNDDKQDVADETNDAMKGLEIPSFSNLSLLEAFYARHPEFAKKTATTREEKALQRKTERFANANSDRARRRISRGIERKANQVANRRAETAANMANATADFTLGEELQTQAWYYNDIIRALTEDDRSSRVHYLGESIVIDTYHPLFKNSVNLKGTIRLTGSMVEQFKMRQALEKGNRKYTVEEKKWMEKYPEDRAAIDQGGLIGAGVNWFVDRTNMTATQGQNLKTAAKLGTLIGLGVLGWMTIKRVFNIGGKYKAGERWGWGLGAATVLLAAPALTGKGIYELLTTGSAKESWNKMKNLLNKNGVDVNNVFVDTNETVILPAMGNLLYGDMTLKTAAEYIEYKEGKYVLNEDGYAKYLIMKKEEATTASDKQKRTDKIALFKKAKEENKLQSMTDGYGKTTKMKDTPDKSVLCESLYKSYIDGLTVGASMVESDKKLKIADKSKFDTYIHDQIVNKKRESSSITKDELKNAGLLVEVAVVGGAAGAAGANNLNTGNTNTPAAAPEQSNWEEFKEWTGEKWDAFKKACSDTKNDISKYVTKLINGDASKDLKDKRDNLENLKKNLADLEKQETVADRTVITSAEIEMVKAQLRDADQMLARIKAMNDEGAIDNDLKAFALDETAKQDLTTARNKINGELKFRNEGDFLDLVVENNRMYVKSCGEKTHIRYQDGKYLLDNMTIPFDNADQVIHVANITNFIKVNFQNRVSANVSKPWKYEDGDLQFNKDTAWDALKSGDIVGMVFDTTVIDGQDFLSSTMENAGGTAFQSRVVDYINYLNTQTNARGEDLWVKKDVMEQLPDDLAKQKTLFEANIAYAHNGNVYDSTLKQVYGGTGHTVIETPEGGTENSAYYDKKAAIEVHGNVVFLRSYERLIPIYPSKIPGRWNIGAPKLVQDGEVMSAKPLDIDFNVQDAIRVANLTNYLSKNFAGLGRDSDPFETEDANLDFDDHAFSDARIIYEGKADEYSKELNNEAGLDKYKDWLHSLGGWESK